MKTLSFFTLLIFTIISDTYGQAFKDHHIITTGSLASHPNSIDIVDLNNDGEDDIIACSSLGSYIYYMENKGNQEFEIIKKLEYDLYELNEVGSGDINNDGLVDLVFSRLDYSAQLAWYKNIGNGEFSSGGVLYNVPSPGWRTVSFVAVDLTCDSIDDIIICSRNNDHNDLLYRKNMGNGQFMPYTSLLDTGKVVDYCCQDIDIDGDKDIIYVTTNPYRLVVAINNGFGDFNDKIIVDEDAQNPVYKLLTFDTDNDSDIDIMTFPSADTINIFLNDGNTQFSKFNTDSDTLFKLYKLKTIDFDNDGDIDIINNTMNVMENKGGNSFRLMEDSNFPLWTSDNFICDINNNVDEDIIFGFSNGAIGYIEDAAIENINNWRTLTSQVIAPTFPAFKDINNDGYNDICLLDLSYYKYIFYLNNGKGKFFDTISTTNLHHWSRASAFHDIDNDGYSDILSYNDDGFTNLNDSSHFQIAKNNADSTFSKVYINDYNHFYRKNTCFIDYNNDSILNAVITGDVNYEDDSVFFLNINPDLSISSFDTIIHNFTDRIKNYKFYDLDRNGENDIILNDESALYVGFSFNNKYNNKIDTIIESNSTIYDFDIGNLTGDSATELIYSTYYDLVILKNYNGISFNNADTLQTEESFRLLVARDLDLDGREETICFSFNEFKIYNDITGNSHSVEQYDYENDFANYYNKVPIRFADIDLDGDDDLLCTYYRNSDVSWFENSYIDTIDYTAFPEKYAVWTEQNAIYEGNPPQTWTSLYVTESDTNLLNNSYTNIYEYYINPLTFDTVKQLHASIRQHMPEKKVYIIRHYLSEINERLLLDFKANVGDTILLDAYYWDSDPLTTDSLFIVDSTNTTIIHNGEERDILYLSNHNEQTPVSLTLIEGVGSIENPFGPTVNMVNKERSLLADFCCPDYLICLSVGDELEYVQSNESRCNALEVWSSIESNAQNQFLKIYPNPTKDKIKIEFFDKPELDFEVVLYNNHGSKLSHFYYKKNIPTQTIDFHNYKPGLYLLRISYGSNSSSFKIIKSE